MMKWNQSTKRVLIKKILSVCLIPFHLMIEFQQMQYSVTKDKLKLHFVSTFPEMKIDTLSLLHIT